MALETPEYKEEKDSNETHVQEAQGYVPMNEESLRYDLAHQIEQEDAEVDMTYKGVLLDLHAKFPAIPEKLEGNKTVALGYKNENGIYCKMEVHGNSITLHGEKNLYIRRRGEGGLWRVGLENENGDTIKENLSLLEEFEQGVDDIIKNASKYQIYEPYLEI